MTMPLAMMPVLSQSGTVTRASQESHIPSSVAVSMATVPRAVHATGPANREPTRSPYPEHGERVQGPLSLDDAVGHDPSAGRPNALGCSQRAMATTVAPLRGLGVT